MFVAAVALVTALDHEHVSNRIAHGIARRSGVSSAAVRSGRYWQCLML